MRSFTNVFDMHNKSFEMDAFARSRELIGGRYVLALSPNATVQERIKKMSNE